MCITSSDFINHHENNNLIMNAYLLKPHNLLKFMLLIFFTCCVCKEEFCYDSECALNVDSTNDRFLLYDVNPPEGFNLRRDVYMRFAILAYNLKNSKNHRLKNFKLVLPPWSRLYHWSYSAEPEQMPWGLFFDLNSLKEFAPVIEMHEFFHILNKTCNIIIDEVYILQHFKDMFTTGNFEDKMKLEECTEHRQVNFFFYKNLTSNNVKCFSYHGGATKLSSLLSNSVAKIFLIHHAEVALHDMFGGQLYWQCRRSMRFNKDLKQIALKFRRNFLNSTDYLDRTNLPERWQDEMPHRNAKGGPYLAIHLRRRDFLSGRSHQVPSIENVSKQITIFMEKLNLTQVFIATDATEDEYKELTNKILPRWKSIKFVPNTETKIKFKDAGVAIIEQIICAHARHFIGTYESTFSFRIQEEREILGFPISTTFNSFCKEGSECSQPSVWEIVH